MVRTQAGYYSHVITPAFKDAYNFYHWNHSFDLGYGRWCTDTLIGRIESAIINKMPVGQASSFLRDRGLLCQLTLAQGFPGGFSKSQVSGVSRTRLSNLLSRSSSPGSEQHIDKTSFPTCPDFHFLPHKISPSKILKLGLIDLIVYEQSHRKIAQKRCKIITKQTRKISHWTHFTRAQCSKQKRMRNFVTTGIKIKF